jgi:hypothetical protein
LVVVSIEEFEQDERDLSSFHAPDNRDGWAQKLGLQSAARNSQIEQKLIFESSIEGTRTLLGTAEFEGFGMSY